MFPDGEWLEPRSSFNAPIDPPDTDPDKGNLATIRVSCAWLPYIRGALTQLLLNSTWKGDSDTVRIAQGRSFNLIDLFAALGADDCKPQTSSEPGLDCGDDDMGCCFRADPITGHTQFFSCGVWVDLPGTLAGDNSGQPGAGSSQPTPGGGKQTYCFKLASQSLARLPTTVSTGDTILLSELTGAWTDTREVFWHCPDGWLFVDGACFQDLNFSGSDPLPSLLHMSLVAKIGSTFYDIANVDAFGNPQPFTVPGGHTNDTVTIQANTDSLTDTGGTIAFCAEVTNNAVSAWSHRFDFTTAPFPAQWAITNDSSWTPIAQGVYTPAVGYQARDEVNGGTHWHMIHMHSVPQVFHIKKLTVEFAYTDGSWSSTSGAFNDVIVFSGTNEQFLAADTPPTSPLVVVADVVCATGVELFFFTGRDPSVDPGGVCTITAITIEGVGTDPF
jgi:hypothetical protein